MKKIVVLSSVTYALKAQEMLKSNGIYVEITRSRAVRSIRGGGYGIPFDIASEQKVLPLLNAAGMPIIGSTSEK